MAATTLSHGALANSACAWDDARVHDLIVRVRLCVEFTRALTLGLWRRGVRARAAAVLARSSRQRARERTDHEYAIECGKIVWATTGRERSHSLICTRVRLVSLSVSVRSSYPL